ncbi:hypothetical protein [Clostridium grantii]|uniref:SWIM-type domain-containing protein n=1 Tax=Clostridium grantii DSM 8605 TaxID=1121316 RepID=A0A1M5RJ84_9CLOT|nr:hypothetical protein [Clostridium grantii]SHH26196.1 hypothetical protein SAMN02745207_00558 [Clostridium grantii DSM 8605]
MYSSYGFPEYVSVAERKKKNEKAAEKLKKKQKDICPVVITGRKLASTWWGIAWNKNLESYSDYSNRIPRGRSYVRNGSVLDLKIGKEKISALVQGSGRKPYEVDITITPLSINRWNKIIDNSMGKIDSLEELVKGKFPKSLESLFTEKNNGLFPSPKEIKFDCDCPDWASMCKHVAAVLYGIGARLDENPELFFTLRGININEFIEKTTINMAEALLIKSQKTSNRIIDNEDVSALFDVEMD